MDSIFVLLKDTPIPTILVVSGVVFLFLALAGQIAGKLEVPPARQKWAAAAGAVFLVAGLLLYLAPGLPRVTQVENSSNPLAAVVTQPAQIDQPKGPQDPQVAPLSGSAQSDLASPTSSGAANSSNLGDLDECIEGVFSGIPADRVLKVESGASNRELMGTHQTKNDPAGIILLELGQPVAALTYIFIKDDELFKIGSVVDGACQPAEYANGARGGDRNVLQNYDWLEVSSTAGVYTLRFSYYGGVVTLDTSKFQE